MSGKGAKARRHIRRTGVRVERLDAHVPRDAMKAAGYPPMIRMSDGRCYCPLDGREVQERFFHTGRHRRWMHVGDPFPPGQVGC